MSETKCGHIIPYDKCQECESRRPVFTQTELADAIHSERARLAGLVRAKKKVMETTRRNRQLLGNDTIVQDCKIDVLKYVLALLEGDEK